MKCQVFFFGLPISILNDTSATKNFISLRIAKKISRKAGHIAMSCDVVYANQTRAKVDQCLFKAKIELLSFSIEVNLYVTPLGSYDVILGMNWSWKHAAKVDLNAKTIEFLNDFGNKVKFQGIPREVMIRKIMKIKLIRAKKKGHKIFSIKNEKLGRRVVIQNSKVFRN